MSVVTVPTVVRVSLDHFNSRRTKCWIKVFGSGFFAPGYEEGCVFELPSLDAPLIVNLPFRTWYKSADSYFFVWVFTQQHHDGTSGELKQEAKEAITTPVHDWTATTTVSIEDRQTEAACILQDINGKRVGRIWCSIPQDPALQAKYAGKVEIGKSKPGEEKEKKIERLQPHGVVIPKICKWTRETLEELHKTHFPNGSNITQYLPRYVYRTVNQHCGAIPMWVWPVIRLRALPFHDKNALAGVTNYLLNAEQNARFLLNLPLQDKYGTVVETCEIIGEMQTLPPRAMQYVLDQTRISPQKTQPVDHWAHPHDQPVGDLMSGDCEDFALLMLQESLYLRTCPALQATQICQIEQQFLVFMCAMTLRLPGNNKWTYHMAILKLDRTWVHAKLGLYKAKAPAKDDRQPAMLLEGTAYTTSCWEYTTTAGGENKRYKCSKVSLPDCETAAKTPPSNIKAHGLYGHIISLFSPELWETQGIAQIELGQSGKVGADVATVMEYGEDGIQWVCLQMTDKKQRDKANKHLARLASSYPSPPLPTLSKVYPLKEIHPMSRKRVSCCMRKLDWKRRELDVRKELARKADLSSGSEVGAVKLRINRRQKIVYLFA